MVDSKYKRIYNASPDYFWIFYPENGDSPSDQYESVEEALSFVDRQRDAFIFRSWPNDNFPAYVHYGYDNTIEINR